MPVTNIRRSRQLSISVHQGRTIVKGKKLCRLWFGIHHINVDFVVNVWEVVILTETEARNIHTLKKIHIR